MQISKGKEKGADMKEKELRDHVFCDLCGENWTEKGNTMFATLTIKTHNVNLQTVMRQKGLTMQLGGHAALAAVMGPDEDMTIDLNTVEKTICFDCIGKKTTVEELLIKEK